jgi:demethylmenaquinone methyltransferase/2-methoxy-6-polyprenyl-1,4-benzoquinol methylase
MEWESCAGSAYLLQIIIAWPRLDRNNGFTCFWDGLWAGERETMASTMADYYEARAQEFETVYDKPERQADLARLCAWLADETRGSTLLEVACGTGYWTAVAATTAKSIVATDFNPGPLEIAREKGLGAHVTFAQADAFALPDYGRSFVVGMAHFWWSHISVADQRRFLEHFAAKLQPAAKMLMIDNTFVAGSMTGVSRTDELGNTYQMRRLQNGDEYEVLKNFPTDEELRRTLGNICRSVEVMRLQYYWAVSAVLG